MSIFSLFRKSKPFSARNLSVADHVEIYGYEDGLNSLPSKAKNYDDMPAFQARYEKGYVEGQEDRNAEKMNDEVVDD